MPELSGTARLGTRLECPASRQGTANKIQGDSTRPAPGTKTTRGLLSLPCPSFGRVWKPPEDRGRVPRLRARRGLLDAVWHKSLALRARLHPRAPRAAGGTNRSRSPPPQTPGTRPAPRATPGKSFFDRSAYIRAATRARRVRRIENTAWNGLERLTHRRRTPDLTP